MKFRRLFIGGVLAALIPVTAAGDVFRVGDLGEVPTRRICMSTATEVLEAYIKEYGGLLAEGDTEDAGSWSYYGWDLRPGDIDAVITCPVVAGQVNAFYMLHSSGDDAGNADTAARQLRELWERLY